MTDQQSRIVTRLARKWLPTMTWHRSVYLRRIHPCGSGPDYRKRAIRVTPAGRIVREPVQSTRAWAFTRAVLLAALIVGCASVPARADDIVFWPRTNQRVYVVDVRNVGPYGRITKPRGIDVIVIRHGNRWGVLPPSSYRSR